MGIQPILPITVHIKKIKGAAHLCYSDGDGVVRYEQTFTLREKLSMVVFFVVED